MSVIIKSGATADTLTVDATSKAARVGLYDTAGNNLDKTDKLASGWSATSKGMPIMGVDYKTPRVLRLNSDGSIPGGDQLAFLEQVEGATLNTNLWTNTNTTMTVAQAAGLITLNNSAITTTTTGNLLLSNRSFQITSRGKLIFRTRQRHTAHGTNNLIELGFGTTASATAAGIGVGAVWRKDGTGQYVPVISIVNGSETLGTAIPNATFVAAVAVTEYAIFEIELESSQCVFRIYTAMGVLFAEETVPFTATTGNFQATHVQAMIRLYHAGAAGAATQALIGNASVWISDQFQNKFYNDLQSSYGLSGLTIPTTYAQAANYANSAAPASATLSNTAAGYTTLGGQWQFAAVAGAETDYALFGFTVTAPYTFYCTGVQISAFNMGAAVATTATSLQWAMGFHSTAVSLATASVMRVALGQQSIAIAGTIGQPFNPPVVERNFSTPYVVGPGRFVHVILKMPTATATASQIIRGTCLIQGYFE